MNTPSPSHGAALVQGASRGIGLELARQLLQRGHTVVVTSRNPDDAPDLDVLGERFGERLHRIRIDLEAPETIEAAAVRAAELVPRLDLLINASGLLHDGDLQPERKAEDLDPANLARSFAVNAIGPALVAKAFRPLLTHDDRAVLANISARVGSIGDNHIGGWYGYRASKAAQNQFTRTLAIEFGRRSKNVIVLALHPGTVDTDLSKPFQRSVPDEQLFSVQRAAGQLLAIIDGATADDSGCFYAWDGKPIEW